MTQHNSRKEPTFGEPSITEAIQDNDTAEPTEFVPEPKISITLNTQDEPNSKTSIFQHSTEDRQTLSAEEEKIMSEMNQAGDMVGKKPQQAEFNFAPVAEHTEHHLKTETAEDTTQHSNLERVIPASSQPSPIKKITLINKIPSKYRRLVLVIGLILLLLLLLFWLKPNTPETVEQLQEQGTSLPIEFRPVDEEEAKRAEAEAKALQEAQAQQALAVQQAKDAQHIQSPTTEPATPIQTSESSTPVPAQPITTPVTNTSTIATKVPNAVSPSTQNESVIYQPESKPASQTKTGKVEKPKSVPKNEAQLDTLIQVVDAKPATPGKTKTLTVPKGVSLMQVFRDNQLNIADVNAMSKVNNVVSNLKAGEKVTVTLDNNNRVVQMNIGSGGQFIRQANGTYLFK